MAVNLSALSSITTTATALSNLILVTPQKSNGITPQAQKDAQGNVIGTPPEVFLFDTEGENTVLLEADITDHYVEDNTAIQDQFALRPEVITVQGFVGELNDIVPPALAPLKLIADKLTVVGAYTPVLTASGLVAYNTAVQAYAVASLVSQAAISAWNFSGIGGDKPVQNKQQAAFSKFYGYFNQGQSQGIKLNASRQPILQNTGLFRQLFTVQTPWNTFDNMAIKSLRAIQDADTNVISSFEITFKKIRFTTSVQITAYQLDQLQGQLKAQAAQNVNNGTYAAPKSATALPAGGLP